MPTDGILLPKTDPINATCNYFKGWEVFEFRMLREGRLVEFREAVRESALETGNRLVSRKEVQKRFGYKGLREERQMMADYIRMTKKLGSAASSAEAARRAYHKGKNRPFEEALASLPATASPSEEMDWIKSHPAMSRKDRTKPGNTDRVLITPEDIHFSPNGPCPSRSAAQQLQHWANRPEQFYKDVLSETKKAKAKAEDEKDREGKAVANAAINEMLDALFGEPSADSADAGGAA